MARGPARLDPHGLVERGERLFVAIEKVQGLAAPLVARGPARLDPHGLAVRLEGLGVPAEASQGAAAPRMRSAAVRVQPNRLAVRLEGLPRLSLLHRPVAPGDRRKRIRAAVPA